MNKALHQVGEYVMLMGKCISVPNRWSMFFKQLIKEIYKLGVDSLWIVADHASISTEMKVVQKLKEEGRTKDKEN